MIDILTYGFVQKAILAGILISISTSLLGVFLILRRMSLIGDGLAHASFGGIAVGLLTGAHPLFAALAGALAGSVVIQKLIEKSKVYGDAAIALILSTGMAVAIVIIGFSRGFNVNLFSFLFGSILSISNTDLLILGGLAFLVAAFLGTQYRKMVSVTFNEDMAKTSNIKVGVINMLFVALIAVSTVAAIRAVGILLVTGLFVIPGMAALLLARSFKHAMVLSLGFGLVGMLVGIFLAFLLDLPPSGVIVLVLMGMFSLAALRKRSQ